MNKFEWCRKKKYDVTIELGCYLITEDMPLLDGFLRKEFNGNNYAIKRGFNILEQYEWYTSPDVPYIVTGTVGERWIISDDELKTYDVDPSSIGVNPIRVSTVNPDNQEFLRAYKIDESIKNITVAPFSAFSNEGINPKQVYVANSEMSKAPHNGGDYVITKYVPGQPDYMEYPADQRNSRYAAKLYEPRIVNGSIMEETYDHAENHEDIINKYPRKILK